MLILVAKVQCHVTLLYQQKLMLGFLPVFHQNPSPSFVFICKQVRKEKKSFRVSEEHKRVCRENALLLSQTPLSPAERQWHEYSSVEALSENREIKGPCFTSLDFPFLFFPLVCVFLAAAVITVERAEWQNSWCTGINEPLPFHAFKWLSNDEKQRKSVPALCVKNVLYQNVYVRMSKFDITAEIFYIYISLPWATQTRSQIWPGESYCTSPASILACSALFMKSWCECVRFADCVWSLLQVISEGFEQVFSI